VLPSVRPPFRGCDCSLALGVRVQAARRHHPSTKLLNTFTYSPSEVKLADGRNDIIRGKTDSNMERLISSLAQDTKRSHLQLPSEIALLLYPDAQLAAIYGLTDLFQVANSISSEQGAAPTHHLRVSHWQPQADKVKKVFSTHKSAGGSLSALILPPSLATLATIQTSKSLSRWLKGRHQNGTIMCSVCAGAFLLADTGMVSGRTITTHWQHGQEFRDRFPETMLDTDRLIIDDGDVISAGGGMAWIDLGLHLIAKLLSPTVMLATARYFLVDPAGRQQSFYSHFSPGLQHGDAQVLKLQRWLHEHYGEALTVPEMAGICNLGERTLLRRFHKATGFNPGEYLQLWRTSKAKQALEFSTRSVEEIALAVGYQDTSAFRMVFKKVVGLAPSEYRNRFGLV
jgi:transcriptional regulator GlxA family with amidase domain